ncbi:MAG: hypothetical protein KC621_03725 [Myxococcales bacterium]|nr:hypothetical protein [Myxococcales bacterium]
MIGDSVNVAARLMGRANPGQILASRSIHQAAGADLRMSEVGTLTVKGRQQPVEVVEIAP